MIPTIATYTPQASAAVNAEFGAAIMARINEEARRIAEAHSQTK